MLNIKKLGIIIVLSFFISTTCFAQVERAEHQIDSIIKKLDVVGLAVAVIKENEIIYTHSFGHKDREQNIALADQDIFRIASISKSFSATSIMQLVEAGKISLQDDFSNLVGFKIRNPNFPDKVITLKMVMSHTSSINDKEGYFNLDVINPDKNPNWKNCYNKYAPGEGYEYCNLNYNMVGTIIEKQSGERFDQYVVNHILKPLQIYGGYCVDSLDQKKFVNLYEYNGNTKSFTLASTAYIPRREELKSYVMGYSTPILSPTGGMKISATDLSKYMRMHMNMGKYNGVRIISRKSAKLMQTKVSDGEGGYGLAIKTMDKLIPGKVLKGHTGSAYGLYSAMFFDPKKKFGFVVITNGCNPIYVDGMNEVLRSTINVLYNNLVK